MGAAGDADHQLDGAAGRLAGELPQVAGTYRCSIRPKPDIVRLYGKKTDHFLGIRS
jgi:hypothetical protein